MDFWQRVVRGLRIWRRLDHPNIHRLLGFCLKDDFSQAWLVTPYALHFSVYVYLREENPDSRRRIELVSDLKLVAERVLPKPALIDD